MQLTQKPETSGTAPQIALATAVLRRALANLEPGAQISLDLIDSAFAAVHSVSDRLHSSQVASSVSPSGDFDRAMADYRSALREWQRQLPRVQGWLLAEKASLEARSEHARSVSTWLETHRQTK
jgi:hypothetical protein